MLIEFRVKNFRSYKDEQTLSMVATTDKTLEENMFATDALRGRRLLKSAAIYGANASGKSNLLGAFIFAERFITNLPEMLPERGIPVQPFRLAAECADKPSEFEFTFVEGGTRFQYGFAVSRERVHRE